jgi:hypothetical protein
LRYHHAQEKAVYLGVVANTVNRWLAKVNHRSLMDDSVRKYAAQPGFKPGLYDALWAAGFAVMYGPQRGQPKGCLKVETRQAGMEEIRI